jgi:hypothetical protein
MMFRQIIRIWIWNPNLLLIILNKRARKKVCYSNENTSSLGEKCSVRRHLPPQPS